jgi:hydrogenase expression/formation protein HypE
MSGSIQLAHGSGGQLTHELIRDQFSRQFSNPILALLGDSALVDLGMGSDGRLALTTDSYVVQPLFFPGGDIGKLAVCGTVNDLSVAGARPLYLTAGFILEEGLPLETLERVVGSMAQTARQAGVQIVAGDTKVVERGAADQLFINTAGLGVVPEGIQVAPTRLRPGDQILINGPVGDHGMAVMVQREGLQFSSTLVSDCAPLNDLLGTVLTSLPGAVHCMRDPTRGGLATTMCEWAGAGGVGIEIEETAVPIRDEVRAICEALGLDPLYAACEGKAVIAVAPEASERALELLRGHPLGRGAQAIGRVTGEHAGRVALRTFLGTRRPLEMLVGAQLPRIC